jgi:tetratricopeptide (TPR) repeat protein
MTAFVRPDTAVIVRQRLLENAEDVDALFVLAALNAKDGRLGEGIRILDRVLRLDPAYPGGWRFKAKLHRMRGEDEAERSAWARAEDVER